MKESEIAKAVVGWLTENEWDVYKEVCLGDWAEGAPKADIVAVNLPLIWIIETKTRMSLSLLDQVFRIYRYYPAHYISVAVGTPACLWKRYYHFAAKDFLQSHGIGLFYVSDYGKVNCILAPQIRRKIKANWILKRLHREQKHSEAGTKDGNYFTPFKATLASLYAYLSARPGSTLNEIMSSIKTHYNCENTARAAIAKYIRDGVIKGIRIDKSIKPYRYYLEK